MYVQSDFLAAFAAPSPLVSSDGHDADVERKELNSGGESKEGEKGKEMEKEKEKRWKN